MAFLTFAYKDAVAGHQLQEKAAVSTVATPAPPVTDFDAALWKALPSTGVLSTPLALGSLSQAMIPSAIAAPATAGSSQTASKNASSVGAASKPAVGQMSGGGAIAASTSSAQDNGQQAVSRPVLSSRADRASNTAKQSTAEASPAAQANQVTGGAGQQAGAGAADAVAAEANSATQASLTAEASPAATGNVAGAANPGAEAGPSATANSVAKASQATSDAGQPAHTGAQAADAAGANGLTVPKAGQSAGSETQPPAQASTVEESFIAKAVGPAQMTQRQTGVPASVTIAQAMLESDLGRSQLSEEANNYFGIKATSKPGTAGVVFMKTTENVGGKDITVTAPFRAYNNMVESFVDHAQFFLENSRYATAMQNVADPRQFARLIQAAGYATDPQYANKLIALMDKFDLYAFDSAS